MKKSEALKILGLSDGATDDEVKKAHRKLVVANHPDKFAMGTDEHDKAEELTKQINEARDVLINRSWTPEFDPRRDPRPYAGNPYAHPSGTGSSGAGSGSGYGYGGSSSGGSAYDPFAGWPFGTGQTTYVWTSWDDIFTGTRGTSGTGASGAGTGANSGQSSQTSQNGTWPFGGYTVEYDPLDPFAAFRTNYAKQQSPEEVYDDAKKDLTLEGVVVGVKAAVLAGLSVVGSMPAGLFVYVMISIIFGLYKRLGSFFVFLLVPIMLFGAPLIFMLFPHMGYASSPLVVAFFIAVLFDVTNLRDRIRVFMAAKKQKEA